MTTDTQLAALYRQACLDDQALPTDADARDLVELAAGRLAGERRQRLVEAIAGSPALAAAYRMAKAGGDWSQALAEDLARTSAPAGVATPLVARPRRSAVVRRPFAIAAAVSAMAVGAVFVAQQMGSPVDSAADQLTNTSSQFAGDDILAVSFGRNGDEDQIFSSRTAADDDRIFAGKDS